MATITINQRNYEVEDDFSQEIELIIQDWLSQ